MALLIVVMMSLGIAAMPAQAAGSTKPRTAEVFIRAPHPQGTIVDAFGHGAKRTSPSRALLISRIWSNNPKVNGTSLDVQVDQCAHARTGLTEVCLKWVMIPTDRKVAMGHFRLEQIRNTRHNVAAGPYMYRYRVVSRSRVGKTWVVTHHKYQEQHTGRNPLVNDVAHMTALQVRAWTRK